MTLCDRSASDLLSKTRREHETIHTSASKGLRVERGLTPEQLPRSRKCGIIEKVKVANVRRVVMDLSVIRELVPNFQEKNFIMFDEIISLTWGCTTDVWGEEYKHLILEMTSSRGFKIVMEFINVRSFHFDGNGDISGFTIDDMSQNGYEHEVRYRVWDFEENSIRFYCSDIVIKSFDRIV